LWCEEKKFRCRMLVFLFSWCDPLRGLKRTCEWGYLMWDKGL
jgi:hypothetical protein